MRNIFPLVDPFFGGDPSERGNSDSTSPTGSLLPREANLRLGPVGSMTISS